MPAFGLDGERTACLPAGSCKFAVGRGAVAFIFERNQKTGSRGRDEHLVPGPLILILPSGGRYEITVGNTRRTNARYALDQVVRQRVSCRIGRYPVGSKLRMPVVQKELVEAPGVRNLKDLRASHDEPRSVDLLVDW